MRLPKSNMITGALADEVAGDRAHSDMYGYGNFFPIEYVPFLLRLWSLSD
jgi:hypothetical protein